MSESLKSDSSAKSGSELLTLERTRLAYERTQLAWIRTATSLIAFGFTVYKFFQYEHDRSDDEHPNRLFGARQFAILMIGIGLLALLLSTIDHVRGVRALRAQHQTMQRSLAGILAFLIFVLGTLGMLAVVFRQ